MTLIHSPKLLILDEPTVGVDPLLRERIWTYLLELVSSRNTTVIITTHYIEEARQSHVIGLMRGGRLIVETSPASLMQEYGTDQLEDIVVNLCRKDNTPAVGGPSGDTPSGSGQLQVDFTSTPDGDGNAYEDRPVASGSECNSNSVGNTLQRIWAVIEKNTFVLLQNKLLLLFMIILPAVHITALCLAMGGDPKPMTLGVVNHELSDPAVCLKQLSVTGGERGCDVENLSCQVLRKLPPDVIKLINYECREEAVKGVEAGDIWGYLSFPEGYSNNVYTRAVSGNIIDNETLQGSVLHIRLDQSNNQIGLILKRIIYDAYKEFVKGLLVNCGFKPQFGESPIVFGDSIYGSDDPSFRQFIASGALIWIFSFYPLCSTAISFIWDKKQGTMERASVAGVRTFEVMTAFIVTEGVVLIIQMTMGLSLMIPVFGVQLNGPVYLALALCFLTGMLGISSGLLLGTVCSEEMEAVLIALTTFIPNFLITGMFWPIEGLPNILRWFSTYFMPSTLSSEASRSIFSRGWGLSHPNVWPGFLSTLIWISLYLTITFSIHSFKGKR